MTMDQYSQWTKQGGFEELAVSVWSCTGEKTASFLHGQLTNHIKGLKDKEGNYNLLLTTRGKIVGDLSIYRAEDSYYLVVDKNQTEKIMEPLKKLAPLSRVTLTDEAEKYIIIHVSPSPHPSPLEGEGGRRVPDPRPGEGAFASSRLSLPGWDVFVPFDKKSAFISDLERKGLVRIDSDLHEVLRIEQGIAKYGIDFDENNLPQEARLERALHFDKGCYLGQEIVARLQYRGHVNKVLVGLKIEGVKIPPPGTKIYEEEKEVGKITSCLWSPKLNAPLALGYLPYSTDRSHKTYRTYENQKIEIVELPLYGRGHPAPTF